MPPAAGIVVEFYFGKERSEVGERISGWALKLRLEEFQIDRAGDDVVATDEVRGDLDEGKGELGFEIKLVAHDHFAVGAILACFALYHRAPSFDVDKEGELAGETHLLAGGAAAETEVDVGIEQEDIARRIADAYGFHAGQVTRSRGAEPEYAPRHPGAMALSNVGKSSK